MKKNTLLLVFLLSTSFLLAAELHLVSWNVRCVEKKDSLAGDAWSKRVPEIANLIHFLDFDIIGIQESDSLQSLDLNRFLDGYSFYGPDPESANPIFYKNTAFEVLDSGFFWISKTDHVRSRGWDARDHRTCVWLKLIQKDSQKIFYVFNTHWDHKGAEARYQSALQMLEKIPHIVGDDSWFYLGDLNAKRHQKALKTIEKSGVAYFAMDSASYVYAPTASFNHYKYDKVGKHTIDHILYSGAMSILRYGILNMTYWDGEKMRVPSDHHPIFMHVKLK